MADFDSNRLIRGQAAEAGAIDLGLRNYMLRVYNYMMVALVVTGFTAYGVFNLSVAPVEGTNQLALTSLGQLLFTSPLKWVVIFSPLAMVLLLNARMSRMSLGGAQTAFWLFSGLIGVSMASIFLVFTGGSIAEVFFITAAAFGGLSLFGYTTKRDLSGIGSFLIMGVWGLIIASVVNIFMHNGMMQWIISIAGVGIFAGLTAYDTQRIKEMYYVGDDGTVAGKKSILGALSLYLDFINMFQFLLSLMGSRR